MILSKKTKHALKAVLCLARNYKQSPVLVSEMASKERIPRRFLETILLELKRSGILASRRGKGGGYTLCVPPGTVTVGRIVRLLDGPLAPIPCVSMTAYKPCDDCEDESTCAIRLVMKEVRDTTAMILDNMTLEDMMALPERLTKSSIA